VSSGALQHGPRRTTWEHLHVVAPAREHACDAVRALPGSRSPARSRVCDTYCTRIPHTCKKTHRHVRTCIDATRIPHTCKKAHRHVRTCIDATRIPHTCKKAHRHLRKGTGSDRATQLHKSGTENAASAPAQVAQMRGHAAAKRRGYAVAEGRSREGDMQWQRGEAGNPERGSCGRC